ncbi:ABC transporter substrate-binding protein [Paraburkholderia sp.]|uniref:ABC transporter substrate-binding protein n=1 Tax=Paraburkholderia sp. TaxID=1926495 RepID=UPI0023A32682|nr:ABC transporter substrate-binding protein [Paraburkholderia sp.]MDE1179059.1 ABC transporter substrate-binding protein [Paraburkholderia sp.]
MLRRQFLQAAALAPCFGASAAVSRAAQPARAPVVPRVVVLDWGVLETLLAMGVVPVGAAEIDSYRDSVVSPDVPSSVADVGLRLAPSLELLQQIAPDRILINSSQESQRAMLERIAPVDAFAIYTDAGAPYQRSQAVTLQLGRLCACEAAARDLIASTQQRLTTARAHIATQRATQRGTAHATRPLYLIRFFDARHIGVYGAHSLFQDVLDALDASNAWRGQTDYWGIGVTGIEALAAAPDADVLYFDPLPGGVARTLATNRLWHALPAVAAGRVAAMPPFWGFGMLPSAARFADALSAVLADGSSAQAAVARAPL